MKVPTLRLTSTFVSSLTSFTPTSIRQERISFPVLPLPWTVLHLRCVMFTLGEVNFSQICNYLKDLSLEDIVKVGTSLGLKYSKLCDLTADKIPHEMIGWWLGKRDNVMEISGTPTLRSLINALQENGFNGHVKDIEESTSVCISKKGRP